MFSKEPADYTTLWINASSTDIQSGKTIFKRRKEKREMINLVWIFNYSSKWLLFPKQRREISIFQFYSMNVIYDKYRVVIWPRLSRWNVCTSAWGLKGIKNSTIKFHFLKLLPEKFLQFDWLRAVVLQLNSKLGLDQMNTWRSKRMALQCGSKDTPFFSTGSDRRTWAPQRHPWFPECDNAWHHRSTLTVALEAIGAG